MAQLHELFISAARIAAGLVDVAAVLFIAIGAVSAVYQAIASLFRGGTLQDRKKIWLRFASWLLLGLEFALASDIIHSILSPTWQDIGQLAAIAAIRTLLSYFLGRDIEEMGAEAN